MNPSMDICNGSPASALCQNECGNSKLCFNRNFIESLNEYVSLFNENLELIDFNGSCSRRFKNPCQPKDALLGKSLYYYITPDQRKTDIFADLEKTIRCGKVFELDDFCVDSPVFRKQIHIKMKVFKCKNVIFAVSRDIEAQPAETSLEQQLQNRINELVLECRNLKEAMDIILNRLKDKQGGVEQDYGGILDEVFCQLSNLLNRGCQDLMPSEIVNMIDSVFRSASEYSLAWLIGAKKLTSRESQIANLIRMGKTTKEISEFLYLSCKTVDFHRANIRKKLDLTNSKTNLRATLFDSKF